MDAQLMQPTVVILDDEKNIRKSVELVLGNDDIKVLGAHDTTQAYHLLNQHSVDLLILDIELGEVDGITFFKNLRSNGFQLPVLFISGHASLTDAAEAVKIGGIDFIEKPFDTHTLVKAVNDCLEQQRAKESMARTLKGDTPEIIGEASALQKVKSEALKVATSSASVLLTGESGTGKELFAQYIHNHSDRHAKPFITVNCSAIPDTLIESELFGHEKGAFTGAVTGKKGYFEQAHTGTLFLDEIADLSLSAQAKTLRALESGEIQKVGSEKTIKMEVRIIAGTHKDLKGLVSTGQFREDLLYRLNVVPIKIPSLRERIEDIPLLIHYFLTRLANSSNTTPTIIDGEAMDCLKNYYWPGNIRELKNLVERLLIMSPKRITLTQLPLEFVTPPETVQTTQGPLKELREQAERQIVIDCLKRHRGNISQAAKELALGRSYLHKRMKQLGIEKREYFT